MALQGSARDKVLYLTLSESPVTGILYGAVTVAYKKQGAASLSTKVLAAEDWVELGSGFYTLKFSEAELDTIGPFFYKVSGTGFDMQFGEIEVEPVPIAMNVAPSKCLVTGNVVDIGGAPTRTTVLVRPVDFPVISGPSALSADPVQSFTDALGNFSVELIRGQVVIFEVERTGIRNQVTIPDQETAQLVDLLPP